MDSAIRSSAPRTGRTSRCKRSFLSGFASVALTSLIAAQPAGAGEGYFLGISVPSISVEGDFDGESFFLNPQSIELIPAWDESTGYRFMGGFRDRSFFYVASYTKADLDGDLIGFPFSGEYEALYAEVSYLFLPRNIHPYVGGGLGFAEVKVRDGSTDGTNFGVSHYKDELKYQVGVGVLFDIGRSFAVDVRYAKFFGEFSEVNGLSDGEVDFDFDGSEISVSMQYYFGF